MAAQAAVLVTALRLPRRDRPHVPLFAGVLVAEVWMRGAEVLYLERVAVPGVPAMGAARALYHVAQALVTAWPAAVGALAWWTFHGPQKANGRTNTGRSSDQEGFRPPHRMGREHAHGALPVKASHGPKRPTAPGVTMEPSERSSDALPDSSPGLPSPPRRRSGLGTHQGFSVAVAATSYDAPSRVGPNDRTPILRTLPLPVKALAATWLAFNVALVLAYPLPQGWTQPVLHAWQGVMVVCAGAAVIAGWVRRRERAAQVAFALAAIELVVATVGPYAGNVFASWRTIGAGMYAVGFSLLAGWQARLTPRDDA
jgi:hypothetical protein